MVKGSSAGTYKLQQVALQGEADGDLETVVHALAEDVQRVLGIDLVTVWQLAPDLGEMTCISSFDVEGKRKLEGAVLARADLPGYFSCILENQTISAYDVHSHSDLAELIEPYFKPNGVKSLLDYVIFDGIQPKAVICCETTKQNRDWTDSDVEEIRKLTVLSSSLIAWH